MNTSGYDATRQREEFLGTFQSPEQIDKSAQRRVLSVLGNHLKGFVCYSKMLTTPPPHSPPHTPAAVLLRGQ